MSVDTEANNELYKSLVEQVFNLAYYGGIDPFYSTNLATEDRVHSLELLKDAKEEEKKNYGSGSASKPAGPPGGVNRPPNLHPRIQF